MYFKHKLFIIIVKTDETNEFHDKAIVLFVVASTCAGQHCKTAYIFVYLDKMSHCYGHSKPYWVKSIILASSIMIHGITKMILVQVVKKKI